MSRAMLMEPLEGIEAIGKALIGYGPKNSFDARLFPYPGYGMHTYGYEKPTLICRWDGIAEDRPTERADIEIPSALRYEVRILHPADYGPRGVQDTYLHAQKQITEGSARFFLNMARNRHLSDLVLDVGVEASVIGDLIDPTTEERFYGHEMMIIVKIW